MPTPAVSDAVICSINLLSKAGTVPGNQYRSLTVGGLRWSSSVATGELVSGVAAFATVWEGIYVDDLDASGVPLLAGVPFLSANEFQTAAAALPSAFPERILMRRMFLVPMGALNSGLSESIGNRHPLEVRSKVRMTERQALIHRIEMTNPTIVNTSFGLVALAGVAVKYDLD